MLLVPIAKLLTIPLALTVAVAAVADDQVTVADTSPVVPSE